MTKQNIIIGFLVIMLAAGGYYYSVGNFNTADEAKTKDLEKFSFFITSKNKGDGGNFGGLAGADAYCQQLAESVGSKKTWAAYLSGLSENGETVDAIERIGNGPWYNIYGSLIAEDPEVLHGENNLSKQSALDENGNTVFGRGDERNDHDILTGSNPDGTASTTNILGTTCLNWTAATGSSAIVGHHDRIGINDSAPMKSWVTSHSSRGCSLPQLRSTGGAGLIYCFAK